MPPNLASTLAQLGTEADRNKFDEIVREYGPVTSIIDQSRLNVVTELNAEDAEPDTVRAWLTGLDIPAEDDVVASWPSVQLAARIRYSLFVDRYDDLWYPAVDDVVVLHSEATRLSILVLDHEEKFTFSSIANSPLEL